MTNSLRCGIANGSVPAAAATVLSSRPAASAFSIASFWASSARLQAPRLHHNHYKHPPAIASRK